MDPARRIAGGRGVNQNDGVALSPVVEERDCVTGALDEPDGIGDVSGETANHQRSDRIVAAIGVADPDDKQSRARHSRCTASFRKWQEQEMQGS
jgi:hypothetical protein